MTAVKKKTIVAIWIGTTVFLALAFFLPDRASNYFLSLRVFHHENQVVQLQAERQKNILPFLRSDKDDARMLRMLERRVQDDGKGFFLILGLIVLGLNALACFLYVFNMRPVIIAAWILGYAVITGVLVLQSYLSMRPGG